MRTKKKERKERMYGSGFCAGGNDLVTLFCFLSFLLFSPSFFQLLTSFENVRVVKDHGWKNVNKKIKVNEYIIIYEVLTFNDVLGL